MRHMREVSPFDALYGNPSQHEWQRQAEARDQATAAFAERNERFLEYGGEVAPLTISPSQSGREGERGNGVAQSTAGVRLAPATAPQPLSFGSAISRQEEASREPL